MTFPTLLTWPPLLRTERAEHAEGMRSLPDSRQNNHAWILFIQLDTAIGYLLSIFFLDDGKERD